MDKQDYDLEEVLDNEIQPLIREIYQICAREGIPMLATFTYKVVTEEGSETVGRCTTCYNNKESFDDAIWALSDFIRQRDE